MHIGRRVAKLRTLNGESLREAALRTGVSHTTIARIEKGEVTGSFHHTLRKIAEGYGVKVEYLLTGRDPKQDFEQFIRRLPHDERSRLYFLNPAARTRMVLDFLAAEYPAEFSANQLAAAAGLDETGMMELVDSGNTGPPPTGALQAVAETLSRVTGISPHWFRVGAVDGDQVETISPDIMAQYIDVIKKASRLGINPHMLEMAVEILAAREKQTPIT